MAVPGTALAVPTFLMFSQLGLTNTPWAVIIPSLISPFGLYLMWTFAAEAIPGELLEAARIDGAGEFRTFFRVSLPLLAPGTLVVDVSCDAGMGFSWARPTSFDEPMFEVGDGVRYYAVDHTPSYLWDSASWEISEALLPFVPAVVEGPQAWAADPTLSRAVEIQEGVVRNPDILAFQHRAADYPHAPRA